MPTISEAMRDGAAALEKSPTPLLDARVLLKYALGLDDVQLIVRSSDALTRIEMSRFGAFLERRAQGEPVAYITGVKEFWSLPFKVSSDVLIPRNDSECLVEAALARRKRREALAILDLGVGSGCLLCALMTEFPDGRGVGVDRSAAAVRMARANAKALGLGARANFLVGDWLYSVDGTFDVIVANPPYIPDAVRPALPSDVADFEPATALFAGADGMDGYRRILADARRVLNPQGLLLLEAGEGQAPLLREMVSKVFDAADIEIVSDLKGRQRGVVADCREAKKGY